MTRSFSRRSFVKTTAFAAGAMGIVPGAKTFAALPKDKLNCAMIGCGIRSSTHLESILKLGQNLVAIVDPDENQQAKTKKWLANHQADTSGLKTFVDYRQMFDKMAGQIDAVFVATPNHHHALPALIAMQLGKNVYCEKPLCHDIGEARKLRQAASQSKVATQMGSQGHCMEGFRSLCEYIWSGTIGKVTEIHSWTNRANGGAGPRPAIVPAPQGLHWDEWIGPAPYRDYHASLHPHGWHGWFDFGNGSIGNMGCHLLDGAFWALKIDHPTCVEAEQMRGGSNERFPQGCGVRWDVPARADMPALKVYWYDGFNQTADLEMIGELDSVKGDARNLPPIVAELRKRYPGERINISDGVTFYVGEKGIIQTNTYGDDMHILPLSKMRETPPPPKTLPRPKDIFADFVNACLAGKTETACPFDFGSRLTEFTLLANLAQRAGAGKKIEWDGPNMKVTNLPELNQWVNPPYRKGWLPA